MVNDIIKLVASVARTKKLLDSKDNKILTELKTKSIDKINRIKKIVGHDDLLSYDTDFDEVIKWLEFYAILIKLNTNKKQLSFKDVAKRRKD